MGGLRKLLEPETAIGCTMVGRRRRRGRGRRRSRALGAGRELRRGSGRRDRARDAARPTTATRSSAGPTGSRRAGTMLMLARPVLVPGRRLPQRCCNARVPGLTVMGGMASAGTRAGANRLAVDDRILDHGAVALLCSEDVPAPRRSCRRDAGRSACRSPSPAPSATSSTSSPASPRWRACRRSCRRRPTTSATSMRDGLHLGVVVDEHKLDFARGDFLVRNVLGADRADGRHRRRRPGRRRHDRAVPGARRGRRPTRTCARCSPVSTATPRCSSPATGAAAACSGAESRRGRRRGAARSDPARGRVLRGRDRSDRRPQLPARLHRERRRLRTLIRGVVLAAIRACPDNARARGEGTVV